MVKDKRPVEIRYPIYARQRTWIENLGLRLKKLPMICTVCGNLAMAKIGTDNFREDCLCNKCNSFNRQRQIAYVMSRSLTHYRITSLKDLAQLKNITIYNTETWGALHNFLSQTEGYVCSEYFGPPYASGDIVNGKLNQDLTNPSFADNSFDYIISTDVFEHIPDTYTAHEQVYRILKPGGRHIFTVPFYQTEILDQRRATLDENNQIVHLTKPWYHHDPIRPDGILCFHVFSMEMLVHLARIGFHTNMYFLYRPINGILGGNGVVFEAIKDPNWPSAYLP